MHGCDGAGLIFSLVSLDVESHFREVANFLFFKFVLVLMKEAFRIVW